MDPRLAALNANQSAEERLESIIVNAGLVETPEGDEHRMGVLTELQTLIQDWTVTTYASILGASFPHDNPQGCAQIMTYGSQRLGVNAPGADIDSLVVFPRFVTPNEFFTSFAEVLRTHRAAGEVNSIPTAGVPIIKMSFMAIDIDLIMARLDRDALPPRAELSAAIRSDDIFYSVKGESSVPSLNGVRVNEDMLEIVASHYATDELKSRAVSVFRTTLRAVRYWAKRRLVFGNRFGYLGGIDLALLTARLFSPDVTPSDTIPGPDSMLRTFFALYSDWTWPVPVTINEIQLRGPNLPRKPFNPRDDLLPDSRAVMPIITPSYPAMNSAHNASLTTLAVMTGELARGHSILSEAGPDGLAEAWDTLFEEGAFFSDFKQYVMLTISSETPEAQLAWMGKVEATIRHLIMGLQRMNQRIDNDLEVIRLLPKSIPTPSKPDTESCMFIGIQVTRTPGSAHRHSIDITEPLRNFIMWGDRGLRYWPGLTPDMDLAWALVKRAELPAHVRG